MSAFANAQDLRDTYAGFMKDVADHEISGGLAGSGVIIGYDLHDPDVKIVLDASVTPTPERRFGVHIDDPNAPEPKVNFSMSGDTFDELHKGELQAMAALMTGKIKASGDVTGAMRTLPALFRAVPIYKSYREKHRTS